MNTILLDPPKGTRERWIRAHAYGDPIAASTLQPGLRWFETSFGAWAHARVDGFDVTLGGPLCEPQDRAEMVRRFLTRSRRPILCYVRAELLAVVETLGTKLHAAGIGVDREVDIPGLLADPEPMVRGALKHARKAGFCLRPLDLTQLDAAGRARLEQITARYLARAQVETEMAFLNWPMNHGDAGPRRVYALDHHGEMFGYAVLNPIFDRGRETGFLLDILRFEPTRQWGVWLATVHAIASELRGRGPVETPRLSLGFAPLHHVQPAPHASSRTLQAQLDWMVRYLATTPYLQRLRALKDAIPGPEQPRYLASYTRAAPIVVYAFLRAMNVPLAPMWSPRLVEILSAGVATQRSKARRS